MDVDQTSAKYSSREGQKNRKNINTFKRRTDAKDIFAHQNESFLNFS